MEGSDSQDMSMKCSLEALRDAVKEQCQAINQPTEPMNAVVKHGIVDKSSSTEKETERDKAERGGDNITILKQDARYAQGWSKHFDAENICHSVINPFPRTRQEKIAYGKEASQV